MRKSVTFIISKLLLRHVDAFSICMVVSTIKHKDKTTYISNLFAAFGISLTSSFAFTLIPSGQKITCNAAGYCKGGELVSLQIVPTARDCLLECKGADACNW